MADYKMLVIDDDRELCALIRQSVLPERIEADVSLSLIHISEPTRPY